MERAAALTGRKRARGDGRGEGKGGEGKRGRAGKQGKPTHDTTPLGMPDEEDASLEAAVFGSAFVDVTAKRGDDGRGKDRASDSTVTAAAWEDEDDANVEVDIAAVSRLRKLRHTEGETRVSGTVFNARLRERKGEVKRIGTQKHWADMSAPVVSDDEAEEDEGLAKYEDALLRHAGGLLAAPDLTSPTPAPLPFGRLSMTRVQDANRSDPSKAVLQSVAFHPSNGSVLLTAGLDKKLRFFQVSSRAPTSISSVFFEDMPIATAAWMAGGNEVLVTGRRPYFYTYDILGGAAHRIPSVRGRDDRSFEHAVTQATPDEPSGMPSMFCLLGNDGTAVLMSQRSKTWIANLKMTGGLRAATFAPSLGASPEAAATYMDLITGGTEGEIYRWDLRTMKCIARHTDEGSTGITALAVTRDGRRYAVGSNMGVVNVYDASAIGEGRGGEGRGEAGIGSIRGLFASTTAPKPIQTILTLTTSISVLQYSSDGAILCMGSQRNKDSLRMVHAATGKTFGNWPTAKTPLGYVTSASFSPNGGYLTVGNDKGRALLYRLNHYSEA